MAYSILVSAPVPFGFSSYWDLVGFGPRGFGTKELGTGLDKNVSSMPQCDFTIIPNSVQLYKQVDKHALKVINRTIQYFPTLLFLVRSFPLWSPPEHDQFNV